ncbi:glycosyltransferase 87 family protein [Streptomyces sp. NPDC046985]|uniref:glycosyltransferase 87 family protein n=1 Tax=Streptomyces sp. NPDC046985 TaxID=3155377 RepID=UPI0033F843DC
MSAFPSVPRALTRASTRHRLLALTAAWLLSRALMLWLLAHNTLRLLGHGAVAREVWKLYGHWYLVLSRGAFPAHDTLWQYPPGAGPVLLSPALLPGLTYFQAFVALTLASDALITLALARAGGRPGRSLRGAVYWTLGLPLLLHVPLARYDVQVTALAVLALLALPRFPRVCGALAALGALAKVWPALVLVGVPRGGPTRSAWTWAALAGAAAGAVLMGAFRNPLAFVRQQGGRGVQIESFGGTALAWATHAGWPGKVRYQYGALEFTGPHVTAVARLALVLSAAAFGLLLLWRVRARRWTPATPYDAALCAALLFTVTSRVISPQYMIWLLGLGAVCLTSRHTVQGPVARLVALASAVSVIAYPTLYGQVAGCTWTGCVLMLVRNGLLGAAAVLSFARLWRSTKSAASARQPEPDPHRLQRGTLSPS